MVDVLVFAEHEPTGEGTPMLLSSLAELDVPGAALTVLMPIRADATGDLMDGMAAARGMAAQSAVDDSRARSAEGSLRGRRELSHVVGCVRAAGYAVHGELVGRATVKAVLAEARLRKPDVVVLVTRRHRLAHLLRNDLATRMRHVGVATVVTVHAPLRR
jgi:hypothetical protein